MYAHGAVPMSDGRVRFRFWAPDSDSVTLHLEGEAVPMTAGDDGWHEAMPS